MFIFFSEGHHQHGTVYYRYGMKLLGPMSVKGLSKTIIPFSELFFDKVKKTIYVAKVDSVKDLNVAISF